MSSKNKKLNLDKDELYELYVNQKYTSKELANHFDCTSKCIRNYLTLYGIPIRQMSEAVALERSKWSEEKERARSLKYMQTWAHKPEEEKQRILLSRGNSNTPESIEKARQTRLKNKSYNKSRMEEEYYHKLEVVFGKDDIIRQYRDDRYPFSCDFYIKSKDLFIEVQGHWTHGPSPFDKTNPVHLAYLNSMNSKDKDMHIWTEKDPSKLQIARDNNIKLLLIYPRRNTYLLKNKNLIKVKDFSVININDID